MKNSCFDKRFQCLKLLSILSRKHQLCLDHFKEAEYESFMINSGSARIDSLSKSDSKWPSEELHLFHVHVGSFFSHFVPSHLPVPLRKASSKSERVDARKQAFQTTI